MHPSPAFSALLPWFPKPEPFSTAQPGLTTRAGGIEAALFTLRRHKDQEMGRNQSQIDRDQVPAR
ncbi:MAG: hypothetical protein ACK2U1_20285, partial [Anaerolineales bacterium]